MKAFVDVVIPVFNAEKLYASLIETIQRQNIGDLRIFVIYDGSTDATPGNLAEISKCDTRVQIVTKTNSGIVDAINIELSHCYAEFIARHDADDVVISRRIRTAWPSRVLLGTIDRASSSKNPILQTRPSRLDVLHWCILTWER